MPEGTPEFSPAPVGAYVSATIIGLAVCPDCRAPLTPTVGMPAGEPTAAIIDCRCGKYWRFLFQSRLEVAVPLPPPPPTPVSTLVPRGKLSTATHLPNGLPA